MLATTIEAVETKLSEALASNDANEIAQFALQLGALKERAGQKIDTHVIHTKSLNDVEIERKQTLLKEIMQALLANIRCAYATIIREHGEFKVEVNIEKIIMHPLSKENSDSFFIDQTEISFANSITLWGKFNGELEILLKQFGIQAEFSVDLKVEPDDCTYRTSNRFDFGNLQIMLIKLSELELETLAEEVRRLTILNIMACE